MQPKLFNETYNTHAEELKRYLPVNINLRFETISSHIVLCEENYIIPLLGNELFTRICDYYSEHPTLADDCADRTLIEKVRFALVRLAIWKGYDVISANISDVGASAEVDKENRLYRYQEENLKKTLKNEGFDYLDSILEYLESDQNEFNEFGTSKYKLSNADSLIKNTEMFDKCYDIGNSRLVYLKMRQYIRDVEMIELQHRIGHAFYQELLAADESLPHYSSIMSYIRLYVVYKAVEEGIGELHKLPTEKGLIFETSAMEDVQISTLSQKQLMETRERCSRRAEQYLSAALHTIGLSPSDYPNYIGFASDSPADGVIHIDNTNRKIFMA